MEHLVRHWYNGKPGRIARRDVKVVHVAEHWEVEARQGGMDGEARRYNAASEDEALARAQWVMDGTGDEWRDLTGLHVRQDDRK